MNFNVELPHELVEAIAEKAAAILAERERHMTASPWLDVAAAADYLACKPQRIYDLISAGTLRPARDGRRVLLHRDWLDACVTGATS